MRPSTIRHFAHGSFGLTIGLLLIACALPLSAQTPDTAALRGRVTDQAGAAAAGVQVTITNSLTGFRRSVETDASGKFSLAGLPVAGVYTVTAQKEGFAEASVKQLTLVGGRAAWLDLKLSVALAKTEVTVTGTADTARTDTPQLGIRLSASQMAEIPLPNRRVTSLPLLESANRPAINQGDVFVNQELFTANGAGRRQTWFEVDGSNASDAWGRQTIFTSLPLESIDEITVLTSAFSAAYGFTAGSVVNIVTKSGGNKFHGDALGLWRPSATEAKLSGFSASTAASGNDLTNDTLDQASLALSGPIGGAGHTQFFLNGEYSLENRASPVTSPVAPGNFVGQYRGWLAFMRIDHQMNAGNNLFFRSDADSFFDTNPNGIVGGNTLPSVDRIFKRRTYSEELGETAVLARSWLNDLRLQFQLASPITEFDPVIDSTEFSVPISTGGVFATGTSQSALLMNRQYEMNDTISATRGSNTLAFGADVIRAHNGGNSKEFGGPIYLGEFSYKPCVESLAVCESAAYLDNLGNARSYTQSYGNAKYAVDDTLWALFAQENFHWRRNVTLNLGLRYERQAFTGSGKDFSPRAGFAYDVRGRGTSVIRGGFGIYYSQIVDNSAANYALGGPAGVFNYTAGPGQIGFPASVSEAPLPALPAGAAVPVRNLYVRPGDSSFLDQYFPTSVLIGYPRKLLNPYTEQWTFGFERALAPQWVLDIDYLGSHTVKVNRPLDVDPPSPFVRTAPGQVRSAQASDCTRPLWIWWYAQHGLTCDPSNASTPEPPYALIQTDVNDGVGFYEALDVNLSHHFSRGMSLLASYTWSHAIDNVDPDVPSQNPNDPNFTGAVEVGNAIFDERHRLILSGVYSAPWRIRMGGLATLGSGVAYDIVTGDTNSGDLGGTTDRPVIDGEVIGRNTGRGRPVYSFDPFLERRFGLGRDGAQLEVRAEAFNAFNHANFVGYSGTWGNGAAPARGFGQPLAGITNQLAAREFEVSARLSF